MQENACVSSPRSLVRTRSSAICRAILRKTQRTCARKSPASETPCSSSGARMPASVDHGTLGAGLQAMLAITVDEDARAIADAGLTPSDVDGLMHIPLADQFDVAAVLGDQDGPATVAPGATLG